MRILRFVMKILKREIIIYLALFIIASFVMHYSIWLSAPIEHIKNLTHNVFPLHPLVYTFGCYIVLWLLRLVLEPLFREV